MPLTPFPSFDPQVPRKHPAPALWLRSHRRVWAFPASATPEQIDRYALWLHMRRIGKALRNRTRAVQPPVSFRVRLLIHRLGFVFRCMTGNPPPEAIRDLSDED